MLSIKSCHQIVICFISCQTIHCTHSLQCYNLLILAQKYKYHNAIWMFHRLAIINMIKTKRLTRSKWKKKHKISRTLWCLLEKFWIETLYIVCLSSTLKRKLTIYSQQNNIVLPEIEREIVQRYLKIPTL